MSEADGELLSYQSLTPHLKMLRVLGVLPLNFNTPKLKQQLHGIYRGISFFLPVLFSLLQIIYIYQVRTDIDKIADAMSLLLTYLDCIFKQFIFMRNPKIIQEMLDIMKGPSFNQGLEDHRPLLVRTINHARFLLRLFNRICITIGCIWLVSPIIMRLRGQTVELTIWVPFDTNEYSKFTIAACYNGMQTVWTGLNNSTIDIFIVFLFGQIKTQISILRLNLENLVDRCREETKNESYSSTQIIEFRFREIIYHYNQIVVLSKINEDLFSGLLFFQFLVSGWIICTTAYRTVGMDPFTGEFLSMILYITCILSEIFLFCFYGNEVAHESEKLMESAYCMKWDEMPIKYRRYLILFMERLKRPIELMAGKIVPLSNNTFVQIVKSSYTFYTLLSNSANAE